MKSFHSISFILCFFLSLNTFAAENKMSFSKACNSGSTLLIAAVGDVLLHASLQQEAKQQGFENLWSAAIPFIKAADIAYANLEGPMAEGIKHDSGDAVYSSFPYFNYDPRLAQALKVSGFDIVSTANNHILDRFAVGIDKTLQALEDAGLAHVGTRKRGSNQSWLQVLHKKNFSIAFIACTEMTNDNLDNENQILYCYKKKHKSWILNTIANIRHQVDAVIVLPHWGDEYHHAPNEEQMIFAHQVLEAGATAVIGSHPHVLQPLQKYLTKDNRETVIMYSLGNFVSNQSSADERSTIILFLGLTKTKQETIINGVRFMPMYMQNHSGLHNIQLIPFTEKNTAQVQQLMGKFLPMGNVLYALPIVTNPECFVKAN